MAYIILADRHAEIDRVALGDEPVTIGRSPECAVQVRDPLLSRQHCRLEPFGDGRWLLIDLDSRNGTFIGAGDEATAISRHLLEDGDEATAISRHLLEDGDVVRFGRSRLCFRSGPFAPPPGEDEHRKRGTRPADPHEALAGTVSGFVLEQDMEEESRISGFPIPKPQPAEPRAYRFDRVGTMVAQLASRSWDTALATEDRPAPRRPLPMPMIEIDELAEASQALVARPPFPWSLVPALHPFREDLQYLAVLASIFAAVAVCLTSLCIISRGW
jgi:hypothetical protein